jgi:hypothetical protein
MAASTRKQFTTLWSVIERMQKRLESEGLDRDAVDAAVELGLETLLAISPPDHDQAESRAERIPLWALARASAKA